MTTLEDFRDRFSASIKWYLMRRPLCPFEVAVNSVVRSGFATLLFTMKCRAGECTLQESFSETEAKMWLDGKTPDLIKTIAERLLDDAQELILVPQ